MSVRIHINELGPIQDSEIELHPFMVFTGESGLGKSYAALLLYHLICSISSVRVINFVHRKWQDIDNNHTESTYSLKFQDIRKWINDNTSAYLGYLLGDSNFDCDVNYIFDIDDTTNINISLTQQHGVWVITVNDMVGSVFMESVNRSLFISFALSRYLCKILLGREPYAPYIFPPARAAFMGGNGMTSSVGMYREFLDQLSGLKTPSKTEEPADQFFVSMIRRLSDGQITIKDGDVFLSLPDGNKIPISAAASSVKELAPFMLLLQNGRRLRNCSVLFEEPEAHVHPKKQYIVMDTMARCINKGMLIQMTTHSDYLLSRLNQLIRLGLIKKKSETIFNEYCTEQKHNRNLFLDSNMIGAYYFEREEGVVKILPQDVSNGIKFSSFDDIVNDQLKINAVISEYAEKAGLDLDF